MNTPVNKTISVPFKLTYLLPRRFEGNIFDTFTHATSTSDSAVNDLSKAATQAPCISYDDAFVDIVGPGPFIKLIEEREQNFAGEAGVWIPERDEVWYTTWINDGLTHVEVLNLKEKKTRKLSTSEPLENPNGGYYHDGRVYFTCPRDDSRKWPGGVVAIDPSTGKVEWILNSYFGLKFDNIDDITWVTNSTTKRSYMFITILPYPDGSQPTNTLPSGLWRWDPQEKLLLPAISRTEFPVANGIRPSKDHKALWLTDFGGGERSRVWGLPAKVGAPAIYRYDLDDEMWPVNKRIFGVARMQAPDGIRIDNKGRVWTAEGEGVVVRAPTGRVLGVFNAYYFTRDPVKTAIVQFELAGDVLVILGQNKIWIVKLQEVVNASSELLD
ncbi:hypothetical protein LTR64_002218 [Lithohypha guttulata]|uniref:uncharacterized protein n=1 Tax=Lithohypha guttulata TaxID=1690604 RepID=UPI002DE1EF0C|nr:hypothetical protein LTR51_001555 [Lithohypha guttulata]